MDNDFKRVQRQISEVNAQSGFRRGEPIPENKDGWAAQAPQPKDEKPGVQPEHPNPLVPEAQVPPAPGPPPAEDTGPPRFSGVNLDEKAAIISRRLPVPLTEEEVQAIATVCMGALTRAQQESFREIAEAHKLEKKEPNSPPNPAAKRAQAR